MKLKELIKHLQSIKAKYGGDLEVVLSSDSEGNSFSTLDIQGSLGLVHENEEAFFERAVKENLSEEEERKWLNNAKVIGLTLFPWEEGFETSETAVKASKRAK